MKKLIYFGLFVLFLISCEETENEKSQLKGTWIENSNRMDTLVFNNQGSEGMFILYRDKEIRNGYLLPKAGAGPYNYTINGDIINLTYSLSSSLESHDYFFSQDLENGKIEIGNFYVDSICEHFVLTFLKE